MMGSPTKTSPLAGMRPQELIDFIDGAGVGLHSVGPDGTVLWANRADYEPLGYAFDEYIGQPIARFHADQAAIEDILVRLESGERIEEYPARLLCKDGSIRTVRITSSAVFDDTGRFIHTRSVTRDVTVENAAEGRVALLAKASEVLSSSLDLEATLSSLARLCVPALADWCGVELVVEGGPSQQLAVAHVDPAKIELARELRQRFPPDPNATRGVPRVLRTGEPEYLECIPEGLLAQYTINAEHERLVRSLGLHSYLVVPIALRGRILGALTLVSAESKRRYGPSDVALAQELGNRAAQAIENARLYLDVDRARREAEEAARRLGLLAELSEAMAPTLDPDAALKELAGFVVTTLADYCVAYRQDEEGNIRRVALAHADPGQRSVVEALVRAGPPRLDDPYGVGAVLQSGEPVLASEIPPDLLERAAQNADHLEVLRKLAPRSSVIVPLKARGRTLGALALASTDRSCKRYEQSDLVFAQEIAGRAALLVDNARLYAQAQQATRARDEMLSIVSHDLRSPLNTIVAACELLDLDPPEDRRARTRASIRRAARGMNRMLEDLLDVTRIDEGRLSVQREPFDLALLLGELVSLYQPVAEHRGIRLEQGPENEPIELDADRNRLHQALSNLLDNALKFTTEGGAIEIAGFRDERAVRIAVADDGPGISPDQIAHVFDRFWRADSSRRGGVGLGLAIARGIAQAHGGDIEVVSDIGCGARFTVVLPRQAALRTKAPRTVANPRTVLVVDDDEAFRQEVIDLLEDDGFIVASAAHGRDALAFLEQHGAPDLMLLDLMMPVMNGWDLLEAMALDPRFSSVPLVVLSGTERPGAQLPLARVAAVLSKPFDRSQLLALARGEHAH